jgi:flagellar protein FliS
MPNSGLNDYRAVNALGQLDGATPHRVMQVMLDTLATRVAEARGHAQRGEIEAKGSAIGKAIGIVEGLVMSLDMQQGGQIAANLEALYDYMSRSLLAANLSGDDGKLSEVAALVDEIKSGWDSIAATANA